MNSLVRRAAAAATISLSGFAGTAAPAQTYPVDCAILLCLAGGWPVSAPCVHARAEFIRRITPWPIEPPLQIWRCPMAVSFDGPSSRSPMERLHEIGLRLEPSPNLPTAPPYLPTDPPSYVPVQSNDRADIDISDDAFDFVRSIRVYDIQFSQRVNSDGDCFRSDATRRGTYGVQGEYRWTDARADEVPPASVFQRPGHCGRIDYRAVFVDWRDDAGNYGFEEIRY